MAGMCFKFPESLTKFRNLFRNVKFGCVISKFRRRDFEVKDPWVHGRKVGVRGIVECHPLDNIIH